jgi:hypothetical protein
MVVHYYSFYYGQKVDKFTYKIIVEVPRRKEEEIEEELEEHM